MKTDKGTTVLTMLGLWLGIGIMIDTAPLDGDSHPMVVVTGILASRREWGPPGFGESPKLDSRVRIFVLKLREPRTAKQLSLPEGFKAADKKFSEIQLRSDSVAFLQCEPLLKKSIGHRITVSGEPDGQTYATDYLPLILHVRLITNE